MNSEFIGVKFVSARVVVVQLKLSEQMTTVLAGMPSLCYMTQFSERFRHTTVQLLYNNYFSI